MMSPVKIQINSEEAPIHWQFAHVAHKRVLDLGCGNFNTLAQNEHTDSVGYFLTQGASFVLGIDDNPKDIAYLVQKHHDAIQDGRLHLLKCRCETVSDLETLLTTYQINVVKSDIEGFEFLLEWLPESVCDTLDSCYIEAHGGNLLRSIPTWAHYRGFHLTAEIELLHASNYPCRVYFFEKNK